MNSLALFYSPLGHIARRPFAIAVVIVYVVSFGSRVLLTQGWIAPFIFLQMLVIWAWYALHAKRLRDAQRNVGSAVAVAIVYAFAIAFVALVAMLLAPSPGAAPDAPPAAASLAELLLLFYLLSMFSSEPHLGWFGYVLVSILVVMLVPLATALLFSVWVGTRQSVAHTP